MKSCYISAGLGVNLSSIREVLLKKGLEAMIPAAIPSHGFNVLEKVKALIKEADLFLAVLDTESKNRNTYIEIGMAVAFGKRILIIAPPDFDVPSDVWSLVQITSKFELTEAVDFNIDQLLAAPGPRRKNIVKTEPPETKPLGETASLLLQKVALVGSSAGHRVLEDMVDQILTESGIQVLTRSKNSDCGPDLAIWSSDLGTILGNPILIELKTSLARKSDITKTVNQVIGYISRSNSRYALVLYLRGLPPEKAQELSNSCKVLFIKIHDLLDSLRNESFASYVLRRRNAIVHGELK